MLNVLTSRLMEFEIKNDVPQHEDEFLELLYRSEAAEIRAKILEEEVQLVVPRSQLTFSFWSTQETLPCKSHP